MRSVSRWLAARARRTVADWRRMRLRRDPRLLEDGHEFKRRTEREGIPTHSVDSGTANHLPQPRGFPGQVPQQGRMGRVIASEDRKSTRLNSSHANISYAVFCVK